MKRAEGKNISKLPSCTEILESENIVVMDMARKVDEIPLSIIAPRNTGILYTSMKLL